MTKQGAKKLMWFLFFPWLSIGVALLAMCGQAHAQRPQDISVRLDEVKAVGTSPDLVIHLRWRILDLTVDTDASTPGVQPLVYFRRDFSYNQEDGETVQEFRTRVISTETKLRDDTMKEIRRRLAQSQTGTDLRSAFSAFEVN